MSIPVPSPREAYLAFSEERGQLFSATRPDHATVERLRAIAAGWREASQHFYAGYALHEAVDFAWGDGQTLVACVTDALSEFEAAVARTAATDFEGIASLRMWTTELGMNYRSADPLDVRDAIRALREELAQRLLELAEKATEDEARIGILIRGFRLETDFGGTWRPEFPKFEVDSGRIAFGVGSLVLDIESAFRTLVREGDYFAAYSVARKCPEGFTSYGLRGWKAAVAGFLDPEQAVERFSEAADEFGQDTHDEERLKATDHWSSINIDLWAKYFRARASVAQIIRTPDRAAELLRDASAVLVGTESGWVNPQVSCFRVVVGALEKVFSADLDMAAAAQAREAIFSKARFSGFDENDRLAVEFLDTAAEAFNEIRLAPSAALVSGRLPAALEVLGRIPLIGSDVASAIRPGVGEHAHTQLLGQQRTWIYRTMESIKDEIVLQKLLLRLMQGQLPRYAQIRHGPIEYGKDIVALIQIDERHILEMYQVKAGNITRSSWPKAREELEEMFQVDISSVQLPAEPDDREGILIFNGHISAWVEPVVEGWLKEQRDDHHRSFRIMHLDEIVTWIVRGGLINELRQALDELDIPVLGR
jgi:hypothetical protein